ncbi:MAG: hypothetical protein KF875_06150 [Trueperaceae bacterium]|nr:hypothetical protein [Trueperaceae bacterium]
MPTLRSFPIRVCLRALRVTALVLELAIRLNYTHVKLLVRLLLRVYRRLNALDKKLQASCDE